MRLIIVLFVLSMMMTSAEAKISLFDGLYKKVDETTNQIKEQNNTNNKHIQTELNAIKELVVNIQLSLEATATGIAGVNNSVENVKKTVNNTADEINQITETNTTTTNTNSGELLQSIFKMWSAFSTAMMLGLMGVIKQKNKFIKKMIVQEDKQEGKLDEWQNKHIAMLTQELLKTKEG